MLLYSAQVIHGIHGCVSAHARHEFMTQWNVIANGHPWKYSPQISDISCHVFHELWTSKGVNYAKFLSENISKNLKIVCQCEYASPDNLWLLMGTAWAWQNRHIRLGYALRRYFMTHLVRIAVNFRDFKLIVVRINWSYCNPLFCTHWQWPEVWLGIAFISKCMFPWRQDHISCTQFLG